MAISRSEFQRRHLKEYRSFLNGEMGQALLGLIELEHPVRLTKAPPSSDGHALCQGYERAAALLRELRDYDFRQKDSVPDDSEELTEEQLATSPPSLTDDDNG